jgi:hypothetical protein
MTIGRLRKQLTCSAFALLLISCGAYYVCTAINGDFAHVSTSPLENQGERAYLKFSGIHVSELQAIAPEFWTEVKLREVCELSPMERVCLDILRFEGKPISAAAPPMEFVVGVPKRITLGAGEPHTTICDFDLCVQSTESSCEFTLGASSCRFERGGGCLVRVGTADDATVVLIIEQ